VAIEAVSRCAQPVDPWWQRFHRFNPRWHVDPPFAGLVTDRQIWVMAFVGPLYEIDRPAGMTARITNRQVVHGLINEYRRAG
jgi:hypothetical protein